MTTLIDQHDAPAEARLRLALKPDTPESGAVDGAWWPRSHDLAQDLPPLVAALSLRLGPVERVVYSLSGWAPQPARISTEGCSVRLDGYRYQPDHTIYVVGRNRRTIVLLVVPPDSDPGFAQLAMTSAATPGDISPIDALLGTGLTNAQRRTAAKLSGTN